MKAGGRRIGLGDNNLIFSWFKRWSIFQTLLIYILGILAAFGIGAILILVIKFDPLEAYLALFHGAFGSVSGLAETLVKATPLLSVGLGITIAFRCRVWNIGAEGQFYMGALAATFVGLIFTDVPALLLIPLVMATGFLAGALWGAIPGVFKAKFRVNEIITSLMMNYIAILFVNYLVNGPMIEPPGFLPQTARITYSAQLPELLSRTRLHIGVLITFFLTVLVYLFLWKTTSGYQVRVVGANPAVARYGGINVNKNIIIAILISGGLAGLAGMVEVCGIHYRLKPGISMGYGFTGIMVGLLGKLNPFGVTLAAIFFGALINGGNAMQYAAGVPVFLIYIIQALVILVVLGCEVLLQRLR